MSLNRSLIQPVADAMARGSNRQNYGVYSFPSTLGPHAMVINFSEYNYDRGAGVANRRVADSIVLPIPTNIIDSFNINVNGTELGAAGAAAAESSGAVLDAISGAGTMTDATASFYQALQTTGAGASMLLREVAEGLDTGVIRGAEVGTGVANNPHLALTFEGVALKQHSFSWTLAPESPTDSENLKNIIRKFKQNILPTFKGGTRAFFQYPKVADIFFLGSEPGYLYFFKSCLVSNFDVNYAGGGEPAFLEGGRPAVVNMNLNLTEMDIHTAEDYY